MRYLYILLLSAAFGMTGVSEAYAQTCQWNCQAVNISWPADTNDPIWELEARPASLSSGPSGSGLEIRDVKFHGQMVLSRGHIPMVNVMYGNGACGPFRDWMTQNTWFEADNVVSTCFAQPEAGTSVTNCDRGVGVPVQGSFCGIVMEENGDSFTIRTHTEAGWYKYTMQWTFYTDGTILPEFGFSHTSSGCSTNPRFHNVYWRLDFDIDDGDPNQAFVSHDGSDWELITEETTDNWLLPVEGLQARSRWAVFSTTSDRGYTLSPTPLEYGYPANPGTGNPSVDNFAPDDIAFSLYRANQFTDGGGTARVDFYRAGSNGIVRGESIEDGADLVVWYRTGATRQGDGPDSPDVCEPLGPILQPIGSWTPVTADPEPQTGDQALLQVYPNPFDHTTTILYSVDEDQTIRVILYDTLGREVRNLYEGHATAGATQELTLDGSTLPNGVYTVQVLGESGPINATRIVLVR